MRAAAGGALRRPARHPPGNITQRPAARDHASATTRIAQIEQDLAARVNDPRRRLPRSPRERRSPDRAQGRPEARCSAGIRLTERALAGRAPGRWAPIGGFDLQLARTGRLNGEEPRPHGPVARAHRAASSRFALAGELTALGLISRLEYAARPLRGGTWPSSGARLAEAEAAPARLPPRRVGEVPSPSTHELGGQGRRAEWRSRPTSPPTTTGMPTNPTPEPPLKVAGRCWT